MVDRQDFITAFLDGIGAPRTDENYAAMYAWIRSEFADGQAPDHMPSYNPLATTMNTGNVAGQWNSAGVKVYGDFASGVNANVATLLEDHPGYAEIRDTLRGSNSAYQVVQAVSASAWGSHPDASLVNYVKGRMEWDAVLSVGPEVAVDPAPPTPPAPTDFPAWPGVYLRNGVTGNGTATWQQRMSDRGWIITVDDIFGPQTENVCRQFQQQKSLAVDGIVGPITWDAAWTAPVTPD